MHSEHFDHLVSRLGTAGTRRRLLRFSALSLAGGLAAFLSDDNESAAKNKKKKRKKKNCPSKEEVCAGKCGTVTYKCRGKKKTADCGACRCDVCASGCSFTSVQAAIDAAAPGDTIRLCLETYTEDIEIDKDLTIVGSEPPEGVFAGTFLQGTGANRVIDVHRGTVRLESLWITGGNGGIDNSGTLTLHRCAVLENTTDTRGGGIYNRDRLEMTDCFVLWNTEDGSELGDGGGGIFNDGTMKMTDCSVNENTAFAGGGIWNDYRATLVMTDCTVNENTAHSGSGIYNLSTATLEMTDCAVSDNTAEGLGGGMHNQGMATLTGCTVTGNQTTYIGGGIANSGEVVLTAGTTVSNNTADDVGGIFNEGIYGDGTSTCSGGSSVSGNTPSNCVAVNGGSCDGC